MATDSAFVDALRDAAAEAALALIDSNPSLKAAGAAVLKDFRNTCPDIPTGEVAKVFAYTASLISDLADADFGDLSTSEALTRVASTFAASGFLAYKERNSDL